MDIHVIMSCTAGRSTFSSSSSCYYYCYYYNHYCLLLLVVLPTTTTTSSFILTDLEQVFEEDAMRDKEHMGLWSGQQLTEEAGYT